MRELGQQLIEAGWQADENQHQVVWLSADFAESDEWALAGYSTAGRWIADHSVLPVIEKPGRLWRSSEPMR